MAIITVMRIKTANQQRSHSSSHMTTLREKETSLRKYQKNFFSLRVRNPVTFFRRNLHLEVYFE